MINMKHFKDSETVCKCGCGLNNVNIKSLQMLDDARELAGIPFKLNRACSCETHNKNVGGSHTSSHIASNTVESTAFDISCTSSVYRSKIIRCLFQVGFTRIGITNSFIHVDYDLTKPQNVIWTY